MSKFNGIKHRVVAKILRRNGWTSIRCSGSHETWEKDGRRIVITAASGGVNAMIIRRLFKDNNIWPIPS